MYMDVLCLFMSGTPYIGPEGEELENAKLEFQSCMAKPTSTLTPDQYTNSYVNAMKSGPLLLLDEIIKQCNKERQPNLILALFHRMKQSIVYHLVIQRFLRLIARQVIGTKDGKELGPYCQRILPYLCHDMMSKRVEKLLSSSKEEPILNHHLANALLLKTNEFTSTDGMKTHFVRIFSQISLGDIY